METQTVTLSEFLLARIAEDEEIANEAARHRTNTSSYNVSDLYLRHGQVAGMTWRATYDEVYAWGDDERGKIVAVGNFGMALTRHIARHDPARVLAECEAKRRIVEFHKSWPVLVSTPPELDHDLRDPSSMTLRMSQQIAWTTEQEYRTRFGDEPPTAPMLRALASIYSDHPDYRDEWRP